jgi:hypothetical protein
VPLIVRGLYPLIARYDVLSSATHGATCISTLASILRRRITWPVAEHGSQCHLRSIQSACSMSRKRAPYDQTSFNSSTSCIHFPGIRRRSRADRAGSMWLVPKVAGRKVER